MKEFREEDTLSYHNILRLDASKFDELLSVVEPDIQKLNTTMRMAISARIKLEVTLRFLASGDSYHSFAYLFRVPVSSISKFLPDVLVAIKDALSPHITFPTSEEEWKNKAKNFQNIGIFHDAMALLMGSTYKSNNPKELEQNFIITKDTIASYCLLQSMLIIFSVTLMLAQMVELVMLQFSKIRHCT